MNEDSPLRVGLIGAGGISGVHVEGWLQIGARVTVYALQGAADLAARYGVHEAADLDELLDRCEIVDIATPSGTHRDLALRALAAGRDVVCEKPLAATYDEAREMIDAARLAGRSVFPAHVVRYFREYATIRDEVRAGRIGRLGVLRLSRTGEAPQGKDWFYDESAGGGLVRDLMIHDIDQARWIAGEITEVYALQNPPSAAGRLTAPVSAHAVLTHASGAISLLTSSWGAPGTTFRSSVSAFGEEGVLDHDSASVDLTCDPPAASHDGYVPQSAGASPYTEELRDFARAIRNGSQPRVTAEDGAIAVAIAEAVMQSIRIGRSVPFDENAVLRAPAGVDA